MKVVSNVTVIVIICAGHKGRECCVKKATCRCGYEMWMDAGGDPS
jgi:hypothetical protein